MGKQINYYMGYKDFLSVAQAALDSGCILYRYFSEDHRRKLVGGTTLDIIQPNCIKYYFHNPAVSDFDIEQISELQSVPYNQLLHVIEAGFSILNEEEHIITGSRLYVITGIYDDDGNWVARSDMLTKIYNRLVRVVKKTAPYTEVEYFHANPACEGQKFKAKKYITPDYYDLVQNKDYRLRL